MTDDGATLPPDLRARRLSRNEASTDRGSRGSHETGESSTAGSLFGNSTATDATLALPFDDAARTSSASPREGDASGSHGLDKRTSQRSHRYRSSGAFLLQDALDEPVAEEEHIHRRRHSRNLLQPSKAKGPSRTPERYHSAVGHETGLGIESASASRMRVSPDPGTLTNLTVAKRTPANGKSASKQSPPRERAPSLDVDSAQIVNMALNLSESRRVASRRNSTQPVPPRLAPLPDTSTTSGGLRQHLQQQRKVSTRSPRPDRGVSPRTASGQKISSPLQGAFDPVPEGTFRYHFTPSTLARAQKAKEHLELMTQYRRLLELVPPLQPSSQTRSSTSSPPVSPNLATKGSTLGSSEPPVRLGREYNPLQYVRNRKVRARERKAIDGEAQGFGDVLKVTDWVDDVAKRAAMGQLAGSDGQTLPPFADAQAATLELSPASATTNAQPKPKRPRVDWVINPADMIADAFWLEQGNNKQLIEDRHLRRMFIQPADMHRPQSRQTEDTTYTTPPRLVKQEPEEPEPPADSRTSAPRLAMTDAELAHSSAREKTHHKLQELRGGFHRRHNRSVHGHRDFFHPRRGSTSDLSESDNDKEERRSRSRTVSSNSKDILEKQMMEMIARERKETEFENNNERESRQRISPLPTPEREQDVNSRPLSWFHSRKESFADASESDDKSAREVPQYSPLHRHRRGQLSLEVPVLVRRFTDMDTSTYNSPNLGATTVTGYVPSIGIDTLPPRSRPGSPPRNPFSKVKHIFGERGRDRESDPMSDEKGEDPERPAEAKSSARESLELAFERKKSLERQRSRSPTRKMASRGMGESHKSHRSIGSIGLRGDDRGGVRGLFKGGAAKIDMFVRGTGSKLGELIWKKEPVPADVMSENTSTDESEDDHGRGRRRGSLMLPRMGSYRGRDEQNGHSTRRYLDIMPPFNSMVDAHGKLTPNDTVGMSGASSQRSSRFDLLRPPRIDVETGSPATTPPGEKQPRLRAGESDISDLDSRAGSHTDGVRIADKRLNSILSMPPSFSSSGRRPSSMSTRHWSISDRKPSPHRAPISKREVARLRALILSSGIKAMEISRRAHEPRLVFSGTKPAAKDPARPDRFVPSWAEIAALSSDPAAVGSHPIARADLYAFASRTLGASIEASERRWQAASEAFATRVTPALEARTDEVRRATADLSQMSRAAADEADEASRDLALSQRLKVKRVVDVIEKMLRRRRRRFRWVRRGLWLAVEWVLVGFMWYVWFVVMILRVFLGVGQGFVRAVRWLLWL